MLHVIAPDVCRNEIEYVIHTIISDFLGYDYVIEFSCRNDFQVRRYGSEGTCSKRIFLSAEFFHLANKHWLSEASLPPREFKTFKLNLRPDIGNIQSTSVPILFGDPKLDVCHDELRVGFDIFGISFFLLSCYEEAVVKDRDEHSRFNSKVSMLSKNDFLDRPIVNEMAEFLDSMIQSLWPIVRRKPRKFRSLISCDVDHPVDHTGHNLIKSIRRVGARVLRDISYRQAFEDGLNYVFSKAGSRRYDAFFNNISRIMDLNERVGNVVCFNFIPYRTCIEKDAPNDIMDASVQALLRSINSRGHEIGFHPGYNTYNNKKLFDESVVRFQEGLKQARVDQPEFGGRQHYLRYNPLITPALWANNKFAYDSSLGFADRAGFRVGTCYEYRAYDLSSRRPLALKNRPLIVMDCAVIDKRNEGLCDVAAAFDRISSLRETCRRFDGDFSLLWHNSYLHTSPLRQLYYDLITS